MDENKQLDIVDDLAEFAGHPWRVREERTLLASRAVNEIQRLRAINKAYSDFISENEGVDVAFRLRSAAERKHANG